MIEHPGGDDPLLEFERFDVGSLLPTSVVEVLELVENRRIEVMNGVRQAQTEALRQTIEPLSRLVTEAAAEMVVHLQTQFESLAQVLAEWKAKGDAWFVSNRERLPQNLRQIENMLTLLRWEAKAADIGLSLAWVIPSEVLGEYSRLDIGAGCFELIDESLPAVLDLCDETAVGCSDRWGYLFREPLWAIRSGQWFAAQALSASILDSAVCAYYQDPGDPTNTGVPRRRATDTGAVSLTWHDDSGELARVLACSPLRTAFERWRPGDPVPKTFNRHVTAHAIDQPDAVSRESAIVATLSALSFVRSHFPAD